MAWIPSNKSNNINNIRPDTVLLNLNRHKNRPLIEHILTIQDSKYHRLLGCMLGLAVGDIIGCPIEGLSFQDIRKRYGEVKGLVIPDYWRHWRLPGLHSDDTQQALAILEAVRRLPQSGKPIFSRLWNHKESEELEIAKKLASLYIDGFSPSSFCWRGTGRGFRNTVDCLAHTRKTKNWPYGCGQPSAGLGAVMRIPPIGILGENIADIIKKVQYVTYITHTDPLAIISASIIAYACHLLSHKTPKSFEIDMFLMRLYQNIREIELSLPEYSDIPIKHQQKKHLVSLHSELLLLVRDLIKVDPRAAMSQIAKKTKQITGKDISPTGGFAPSGVAASLYFFLHDFNDPITALMASINAGGDTDTIGAIVGALAGSLHGVRAYKEFLPDLIGLNLIIQKSQAVIDLSSEDEYDLIAEEKFLTGLERDTRILLKKLY